MELTIEQIQELNHIPTDEVIQDLKDTEREIKDYNDELEVLMRNPPQNRLRIYMIEGHLIQHKELVEKLKQIIDFRENICNHKDFYPIDSKTNKCKQCGRLLLANHIGISKL